MQKWRYCAIVKFLESMKPTMSETAKMAEEFGVSLKGHEALMSQIDQAQNTSELWMFTDEGVKVVDSKFTGAHQTAKIVAKLGALGWEMVGHAGNMLLFRQPMD